jgi:hypothetical protein
LGRARQQGSALSPLVTLARSSRKHPFLSSFSAVAGNYLDQDLSILKVDGSKITDSGKRFKLPGHPASVRMSAH